MSKRTPLLQPPDARPWSRPAGVPVTPIPNLLSPATQRALATRSKQAPQGVQKPAGRDNPLPRKRTAFVGGVVVTVPFDALCPDNQKYGARAIRTATGSVRAGLFLSAKYRAAKDRIEHIARAAMDGMRPCDKPVALKFSVWMPDRRQRDMMNYAKLLCDALSGVCYDDDSLIHFAEWHRVGLDRVAPRIVVTIYRNPQP